MGAVLDRGGNLLVRRVGGLGEVMAALLGPIAVQIGPALMRRAPFVVRRALDHRRLDHRVPEPQLADPPSSTTTRWSRSAGPRSSRPPGPLAAARTPRLAVPVQRGEQEQASRRLGEPLDPRLVQRPHLAARAGAPAVLSGRCRAAAGRRGELQQRQRIALRLVDDAPEGHGSGGGRTGASATPSLASESGAMSSSGNPARSKKPPTPGRIAPSSPIRSPRSRRPTNPTTAPLARSSQCTSSTTMSSGRRDAASRNSASDALITARRSGAGPEPMPSATSSTTRLGRGRRHRSSDNGSTSWWSPAKLTSVSYSTPLPRITRMPCAAAISAAATSSADLPTPGSPVSNSVAPPLTASPRNEPSAASSAIPDRSDGWSRR